MQEKKRDIQYQVLTDLREDVESDGMNHERGSAMRGNERLLKMIVSTFRFRIFRGFPQTRCFTSTNFSGS